MRLKIKLQSGQQTIPINFQHFLAALYARLTKFKQIIISQNIKFIKKYFSRHSYPGTQIWQNNLAPIIASDSEAISYFIVIPVPTGIYKANMKNRMVYYEKEIGSCR